MANYFRITGYSKKGNVSIIIDSYGMFEKKWQFSSFVLERTFDIIAISDGDNIIDVNTERMEQPKTNKLHIVAYAEGEPEKVQQTIDGETYEAIKVADKIYIP